MPWGDDGGKVGHFGRRGGGGGVDAVSFLPMVPSALGDDTAPR